jgi:hypothetical protein
VADLDVIAEEASLFSRTHFAELHDQERVRRSYQLFSELYQATRKLLLDTPP